MSDENAYDPEADPDNEYLQPDVEDDDGEKVTRHEDDGENLDED